MFNQDNFYNNAKAVFKGCKIPKRKPDYISYNRYGEVSSRYWYTDSGVVRASDHWSKYRTINDGRPHKNMDKILHSKSYINEPLCQNVEEVFSRTDYRMYGCGDITSCYWELKTNNINLNKIFFYEDVEMAGYCNWEQFSVR